MMAEGLITEPTTETAPPAAVLLDVRAVASMLGCSTRHVHRLRDGGRMPAPVKLGALLRWRRADLNAWVAEGCQSCREPRRRCQR